MSKQPYVVEPGTYERPLNIVGEHLTVLAPAAVTGHSEIFLQAGPEGSGPPPHSHPWGETFYVMRGEVAVGVEGKEYIARPGTLVHFPAGAVHWFRFGAGGGEMLSLTPDGRATAFFRELDATLPDGAQDIEKILAVGERNAIAFQPPGE